MQSTIFDFGEQWFVSNSNEGVLFFRVHLSIGDVVNAEFPGWFCDYFEARLGTFVVHLCGASSDNFIPNNSGYRGRR